MSGPTYIPRKRRRQESESDDAEDLQREKHAAKAAVYDTLVRGALGQQPKAAKTGCHEYSDEDGDGYESSVEVCSVDEDAWKVRELERIKAEIEAEASAKASATAVAGGGV